MPLFVLAPVLLLFERLFFLIDPAVKKVRLSMDIALDFLDTYRYNDNRVILIAKTLPLICACYIR